VELYPAIDVRGGRVARVPPGHPDDPLELLEAWGAAGARWVHVVDLDRAYGTGENQAVIQRLVSSAAKAGGVRVQVGGGLTSRRDIDTVIRWGAARVIVGAALVATGDALQHLVERHGVERIAAALEVKSGRLAPRGGGAPPPCSVEEYIEHAYRQQIRTLIYTDVARDGSLSGPDVAGARRLAPEGVDVVVSGGVGSLEDLTRVRAAGLAGAIVGRALHEARFTLAQALACLA